MSQVEYFDPDGLFKFLEPQFRQRFPLKDLHWKSDSRPIRTINALHLEFVPSAKDGSTSDSSEILGSSHEAKSTRRHQLPGLKPTPLLKVYIFRCDNKDEYKISKRAHLKAWIDDVTNPGQKYDEHEAYEWLILHVTIPNTPAASEPRSFKYTDTEEDPSRPRAAGTSGSKWPGRKQRTILQRLEQDFNRPDKSQLERIAQLRLSSDAVPAELHGTQESGTGNASENSKAGEDSWQDLKAKLKILLLSAFNRRAIRFETDVLEREMQRQLPGWNFCTFFVLKDGLTRTFESVGLYEDALLIYDELSVELDAILQEQHEEGNHDHGVAFLPFTKKLQGILLSVMDAKSDPDVDCVLALNKPLDTKGKGYRERIMSNIVSIFDFRCYILARQITMLRGIAGLFVDPTYTAEMSSGSGNVKSLPTAQTKDDGAALAELYRISIETVSALSRVLRFDLWACPTNDKANGPLTNAVIDAVVAIWTYSAAEQILKQNGCVQLSTDTTESNRVIDLPTAGGSHFAKPTMSTSSSERRANSPNPGLANTQKLQIEGLAQAACHRADLLVLQRKLLRQAAAWCPWGGFPPGESTETKTELETHRELTSETQAGADDVARNKRAETISKFRESPLAGALKSKVTYEDTDLDLCRQALKCHLLGGQAKSAERSMVDLTSILYRKGDYATAASYLAQLTSRYSAHNWDKAEISLLRLYAKCLQILNRRDEHVRVLLDVVAYSASMKRASRAVRSRSEAPYPSMRSTPEGDISLSQRDLNVSEELFTSSLKLPYEMKVKMEDYFTDIDIDPHIALLPDRDGFQLTFRCRQLIDESLQVDNISALLVSAHDGKSREVWLETRQSLWMGNSLTEATLESRVSTFGNFVIQRVFIRKAKVVFVYELVPELSQVHTTQNAEQAGKESPKRLLTYCYPRQGAFFAEISHLRELYIGKENSLEATIDTGQNSVQEAKLILRSATAGLRLHTAGAQPSSAGIHLEKSTIPGVIQLPSMPPRSRFIITVPYRLERTQNEVAIKLEIEYTTPNGSFVFTRDTTINIDFGLNINVQEIFKQDKFFTRFILRPLGMAPVQIFDATLQSTGPYDVKPLLPEFAPMRASSSEPANVAFQFQRSTNAPHQTDDAVKKHNTMLLSIPYSALNEIAVQQASTHFAQDVAASDYAELQHLLCDAWTTSLCRCLSKSDYEAVALTNRLELPSFYESVWSTALDALPKERRGALGEWLLDWHARNSSIVLDPSTVEQVKEHAGNRRLLMLDFELPTLDYLFSVNLRRTDADTLQLSSQNSSRLQMPVTVGTAIRSRLTIKYTRRWAQVHVPSAAAVEFSYSFDADAATWMIGGPIEGRQSAREDEEFVVDLNLVPLRPGYLRLPTVTVSLVRQEDGEQDDRSVERPAGGGNMLSETDFITHEDGVHVIEGTKGVMLAAGLDEAIGLDGTVGVLDAEMIV